MLELHISTDIQDEFVGQVDTELLRQTAEATLSATDVAEPVEISLVLADDATVRDLNRDHRGVDTTTDVLAFAFSETEGDDGEHFVLPPDSALDLGEVIISVPQAQRQAAEHGHALERELALLVAHGILHLLGYDHEGPEDERRMRALEKKVLASPDIG